MHLQYVAADNGKIRSTKEEKMKIYLNVLKLIWGWNDDREGCKIMLLRLLKVFLQVVKCPMRHCWGVSLMFLKILKTIVSVHKHFSTLEWTWEHCFWWAIKPLFGPFFTICWPRSQVSYVMHPKSKTFCRVCSPVQNILRKKCVNLENKMLPQKCAWIMNWS